ncbi:methylated-DNA--[protein]-cysteine S-methyltransferase [Candidatus Nanosalina sp. VS9-1]|uniref:methylated-DNA--[protein]-cysteine S-methyltransferase n=1 Tax=Candidatus Nanosalina sp. VS9-1 TaxID=3388566 RepID=UPI0039E1B228
MKLKVFDTEIFLDESLVEASEDEIRRQVKEYLLGEQEVFELDFSRPENFTGKVMEEMLEIPRGETRSYGEIAEALDSAAIAVGQACGRNPLPLIVPCHRVVGKSSVGGYCGEKDSLAKKKLLELEESDF